MLIGLDLYGAPEAFHHGVIEPVSDGAERRQQPRGTDLLPENPRGELGLGLVCRNRMYGFPDKGDGQGATAQTCLSAQGIRKVG